jgi:3-mercaptopyruvate sulfurtransferase SseA
MTSTRSIALVILIFGFVLSACSAQATQVQPTTAPTQIIEPVSTPAAGNLPLTEADVPRVSVEEAKTALDSGTAIVVDVRPPEAFETSHVAGAVNIPLLEIERNLTGLTLDKEQWIITYCT